MDFRPPSASVHALSQKEIDKITLAKEDLTKAHKKRIMQSGYYYRLMMDHVHDVLKDIKRVCPVYDKDQGYEIAGFVWFQGWNDMVNRNVYPNRDKKGGYDLYSELMTAFIKDVRRDLNAPKLPFVIGVMGVNGPIEKVETRYRAVHGNFRKAMAAPASLKEFKGNVQTVQTAPFWDIQMDALSKKRNNYNYLVRRLKGQVKKNEITNAQMETKIEASQHRPLTPDEAVLYKRGASNGDYHYLGCGKTMAQIGHAFAQAMFKLQ